MIQSYVYHSFQRLREFAAFLLLGTAATLVWANVAPHGYEAFIESPLIAPETLRAWIRGDGLLALLGSAYAWLVGLLTHGHLEAFNVHFLVNDVFMVFFFGIAAKEVAESILPGGALSSFRKASMPVLATLGGVIGPVCIFLLLSSLLDTHPALSQAWAVPAATDIAYSWLFARLIFGRVHPAVTFLLLLAVLDDMIGMLIIATYYTSAFHVAWLGLLVLAIILCEIMRRRGVRSIWPYLLLGGTLSWFGLHYAGVHASLALVPIVPFMPHAARDAGLFVESERAHDTMNRFEHRFGAFVDVGLFTFGLANAGVALSTASLTGTATWIVFCALLFGKTFGVFSFTWIGRKVGLRLPNVMDQPQALVLGCTAGIGFTVALFVATISMQVAPIPETVGDMLKLGALLSFTAGPLAWILSKVIGVQRMTRGPKPASDAEALQPAEAA